MNFPHHYQVKAECGGSGAVTLSVAGLPSLDSMPPAQFGGPGDQWSPEDLLTAAVADCFALSFRAIAAASKFEFVGLSIDVTGTLDRVERAMCFTQFDLKATLRIPSGADSERAQRLLEKAEQTCLITNSLKSQIHLSTVVQSV